MDIDGYRALWRNRPYRRFWLGGTLSILGDALTRVALTWFVYQRTGSAAAVGWLMVFTTGPIVIGGFLAGWALDRFPRRLVMIADNLVRGAAIALIPLLNALGLLALWHVYAVAAVYGFLMMISLAGTPALIPDLVGRDQLGAANALETLGYTVGSVVGPALGGVLIAWIGAPLSVLVDVVSYVAFAAALASLTALPRPVETASPEGLRMADAVRLLIAQPILVATTLMFFAFNLGLGGLNVWLPILTREGLHGGPRLYGILLSLMAAGETLAALLAGTWTQVRVLGRAIAAAQMLSGLAVLIVLLVPGAAGAAVGLILLGFCSAPLTIWAQTLRMRIIPERLRGRSFALLRLIMQGGNPLGAAAGSLLLGAGGLAPAILASGLLIGLPGLIGLALPALRPAPAAN